MSTNRPNTLYIPGVGVTNVDDLGDEEDIECDDDVAMATNMSGSLSDYQLMPADDSLMSQLSPGDEDNQLMAQLQSPAEEDKESQDVWEVESDVNMEYSSSSCSHVSHATASLLSVVLVCYT